MSTTTAADSSRGGGGGPWPSTLTLTFPSGRTFVMPSVTDSLGFFPPHPTGGWGSSMSFAGNGPFTGYPFGMLPANSQNFDARGRIDPWALGSSLDLLLQGIIFAQCHYYFTKHYRNDKWTTRTLVMILLVLSCVKSALGFYTIYFSPDAFNVEKQRWDWDNVTSMTLTLAIGIVVQGWYLEQIIIIRRNWIPIGFAFALILGALASQGVVIPATLKCMENTSRLAVLLESSLVTATNILIACTVTVYTVRTPSRTSAPPAYGSETRHKFNTCLMLASVPFATVSAIELGMIAMDFKSGNNQWEEHVVANYCLAKIYVICLLRVLNKREIQQLPNHIQLRVVTNVDRVSERGRFSYQSDHQTDEKHRRDSVYAL